MNSPCPYRHIPYSQWRLHVFRSLHANLETQSAATLCFLRPRQRAGQHSIGTRSYRRDARSANDDTNPQLVEADKKDNVAATPSPAEPLQSQTYRPKRKKFDPYSDAGRADLAQLVSGLRELSRDAENPKFKARKEEQAQSSYDAVSRPLELPEVPESPLHRKLEAQRQHHITKRQPLSAAERALLNDPWAKMLASPVRLCQASQARLPIRLFTNWGFMRHPETEEVYLMPAELAGLEELELESGLVEWREEIREENRVRRREEYERRLRDGEVVDNTVPHESKVEDEDGMSNLRRLQPSSSFHGNEPAIRITPYTNLLRFLSHEFTRPSNLKDALPGERSDIPGAPARLIPFRWRNRIAEAQHYEMHRRSVEAATGQKDFRPTPVEAEIQLKRLRWQNDIAEKLLDVLRRRVVVALERMLKANLSKKAAKVRRVSVVPFPKAENVGELLEGDDQDAEDILAEEMERPPQTGKREIERQEPVSDHSPYRPLAARFFVHIGSDISPLPTSFPFFTRSQPLIPPMLAHPPTHQSFPVFPLRDMLGKQRYEEAVDLVGKWKALWPPEGDVRTEKGKKDEVYLVMVKVKMAYTEVLLAELWRLWRYVGGRRGLGCEPGKE